MSQTATLMVDADMLRQQGMIDFMYPNQARKIKDYKSGLAKRITSHPNRSFQKLARMLIRYEAEHR